MLKNRNFRIVFSGQMVSAFGNNLYNIALPWYVFSLTNSKADLALTGVSIYIPAIFGLFAGVWVDGWRKVETMFWSDALRSVVTFGMFLVVLSKSSFLMLLGLVFLLQLAGAFFGPAASSLTPLLVTAEELPSALGMNESARGAVGLLGQVAGGGLMSLLGAPLLFALNCVSFILSACSLRWIHVSESVRKAETRQPYFVSLKSGIRLILKSPIILHIILQGMVVNFGLSATEIAITAYVKGPLHSNAFLLGLIFGLNSIGAVVSGMFLRSLIKRLRPKSLMVVGLFTLGFCLVGVGVVPNAYAVMAFALMIGASMSIVNGSLDIILLKIVPTEYRSRVFAAFNALITLSSPIGLAVFGILLVKISLAWIFILIGSLGCCLQRVTLCP